MNIRIGYLFLAFVCATTFSVVAEEATPRELASSETPVFETGEEVVVAQSRRRKRSRRPTPSNRRSEMVQALQLAKSGQYQQASELLFRLAYSPSYRDKRLQLKYILGLMLYQMKLNQAAAFQFIGVVKKGRSKYLNQALEKLSLAADALGDDTLLNYAISKVKVSRFPRTHRDMLYYRIGEYQMRHERFDDAARSFEKVDRSSKFFPNAKYNQGLAFAEGKRLNLALGAFEDLQNVRESEGITDSARVAALMGKARTLYQKQDWDAAIAAYREVPRDTESWHETIFESSWAMLRSGRFRSALSNFHSLHSAYYENTYLPESLLLRSIVYLYICKYDEMEKVLNLFTSLYKPVYKDIVQMLNSGSDPVVYFNEVIRGMRDYKLQGDEINTSKYRIPFLATSKIAKEGDFRHSFRYIKNLLTELRIIRSQPPKWQASAIGKYSTKVVKTRLLKARQRAGRQIKAHLEDIRAELFDLFEQEGFIRYELINGRKESLKKEMAGKDLTEQKQQIDEDNNRDYYVQNSYEYWPFRGEYWLDELGNYHYVGTQSCQ